MQKKVIIKRIIAAVVAIVLMIGISYGIATVIHNQDNVPAATTVTNGLSAYELAVEYGYEGSIQEWLGSLNGKSTYEIAVDHGYSGSIGSSQKEILVFSELSDGTYGVKAGKDAGDEAVIEIPSTYNGVAVTQILSNGFKGLSSLQTINISNNVTTINQNAFYGCTGLSEVSLPETLQTINEYSFYECSSLESMIIPYNVSKIGQYAFYGCSNLTSVTLSTEKTWSISTFTGRAAYNTTSCTAKSNGTALYITCEYPIAPGFKLSASNVAKMLRGKVSVTDVDDKTWQYSIYMGTMTSQ